jgi:Caspase domain
VIRATPEESKVKVAGNRFALIVSNYKYPKDVGLRQLAAPPYDAEELKAILGHPEIGGFEVEKMVNEPSYAVNKRIGEFFRDRSSDDLLLLYFSCHGIKDVNGELYFATNDTTTDSLRWEAVSSTFVKNEMKYSHAQSQILLLDCCYSGAFADTKAANNVNAPALFGGQGKMVLAASDSMQYAFEGGRFIETESGKTMQSIFTRFVVEGLKTGDADSDNDGKISCDELYDYVYERVIREQPYQTPTKTYLEVGGSIIIAKNPNQEKQRVIDTISGPNKTRDHKKTLPDSLKKKIDNVIQAYTELAKSYIPVKEFWEGLSQVLFSLQYDAQLYGLSEDDQRLIEDLMSHIPVLLAGIDESRKINSGERLQHEYELRRLYSKAVEMLERLLSREGIEVSRMIDALEYRKIIRQVLDLSDQLSGIRYHSENLVRQQNNKQIITILAQQIRFAIEPFERVYSDLRTNIQVNFPELWKSISITDSEFSNQLYSLRDVLGNLGSIDVDSVHTIVRNLDLMVREQRDMAEIILANIQSSSVASNASLETY